MIMVVIVALSVAVVVFLALVFSFFFVSGLSGTLWCFEDLAWHVDDGERQQLPGAPAQIAPRAVNRAVRQPHVDHDVGAVLDEVGKRLVTASDFESAILRGRRFADQIVDVVIAIVGENLGARDWFSGPLLSQASHNGLNFHDLLSCPFCLEDGRTDGGFGAYFGLIRRLLVNASRRQVRVGDAVGRHTRPCAIVGGTNLRKSSCCRNCRKSAANAGVWNATEKQ